MDGFSRLLWRKTTRSLKDGLGKLSPYVGWNTAMLSLWPSACSQIQDTWWTQSTNHPVKFIKLAPGNEYECIIIQLLLYGTVYYLRRLLHLNHFIMFPFDSKTQHFVIMWGTPEWHPQYDMNCSDQKKRSRMRRQPLQLHHNGLNWAWTGNEDLVWRQPKACHWKNKKARGLQCIQLHTYMDMFHRRYLPSVYPICTRSFDKMSFHQAQQQIRQASHSSNGDKQYTTFWACTKDLVSSFIPFPLLLQPLQGIAQKWTRIYLSAFGSCLKQGSSIFWIKLLTKKKIHDTDELGHDLGGMYDYRKQPAHFKGDHPDVLKNWNPPFNNQDRHGEMQSMLWIWAWIVSWSHESSTYCFHHKDNMTSP